MVIPFVLTSQLRVLNSYETVGIGGPTDEPVAPIYPKRSWNRSGQNQWEYIFELVVY